ncbi:hypothetical protein EV426DRAFT_621299 [Tirmania nivea]|nr:hypothetical protein EV426DRAFT_621299 [Tirmania nivea]
MTGTPRIPNSGTSAMHSGISIAHSTLQVSLYLAYFFSVIHFYTSFWRGDLSCIMRYVWTTMKSNPLPSAFHIYCMIALLLHLDSFTGHLLHGKLSIACILAFRTATPVASCHHLSFHLLLQNF